MADVAILIAISDVSYTSWLRTSFQGLSVVVEGKPMLVSTEMGPDQIDAFNNFIHEASREVLKLFVSRQGNVTGTPFEHTSTEVIYRFKEETPVLPQADSLKSTLGEDVKNAIYSYITILWFKTKGKDDMVAYLGARYEKLSANIDRSLYKLHD